MLDALEKEVEILRQLKPDLCVEIGSGSGVNITFLAQILRPRPVKCVAIDINPYANRATLSTGVANGIQIDAVRASMKDGLRFDQSIDVLLFNPPYVPSEGEIPSSSSIEHDPELCLEAAWAGGTNGRYWIDILLPQVPQMLSPKGAFYMVAVDENRPKEIMQWALKDFNLRSEIVIDRRARNEHLSIIKFTHKR